MRTLRGRLPVVPPLHEEQAERLSRVLGVVSYVGFLIAAACLVAVVYTSVRPSQQGVILVHRFILGLALLFGITTQILLRQGQVRAGGALQVISLWLSLTILHDWIGLPLHVVAASHIALAICIGPLLGWTGSFVMGVAGLLNVLIQDSDLIFGAGITPLVHLPAAFVFLIEVAIYSMTLTLTVMIVFYAQRRSEINQVTAEALEVASYSEKKLETIIESMADVLLVVDTRGEIVKANRAAFTLLGYTESELSGKPLRTLLPDIPTESTGVETMMRRQATRQVNKRLLTRDGRWVPVSLSSAIMTDNAGHANGIILVAQDMTELEAVRSQLHRSNVRFNQAITFSRIGVFEYDMDRGDFTIDDNLREILAAAGLDSIETFDDFADVVHPDDRERVTSAIARYRAGQTPNVDTEFRVETNRGPRWIMVRGAQRPESGPRLIGTFMDVTRRKRAELELARRDDVLRAVTASSEAFLRSSDWEAQIPTLLSALGVAADVSRVYAFKTHYDEFGRGLWSQLYEWVAPGIAPEIDNPRMQNLDFIAAGFQDWAEKLAARQPVYGIVSALAQPKREMYEAQDIKSIAVVPVFVQDEWWGMVGFDDCANERVWNEPELDALQLAADSLGAAIYRQRVERDLSENRDFLMTIMQNLGQGVTVVDGMGTLLFVNPAFAELTGVPADKLLGHNPDELIDPEQLGELRQQQAIRATGRAGTYTTRIVHADGYMTDVLISAVPRYVDGKPDGAYCVITDISERRRIEENRVALTLEREQMRIMADFVRDASHDFRTPLSIIQTSLYLLRRKAESPEQMERLNTVGLQASRLSRLIDGLLTMLELDKAELTLIPINMKTVAQNAVDRIRETAHKVGLSIDLTAPDEPALVNGEEGYLMKAVANLIDNAVAFTPSGGRIRVAVRVTDETVVLEVSDTGIGIAEEEHERIFERLYKVDKARTIDSGGLGMGLSITRRIMELHGGTVAVQSQPGEGSTFTLGFTRVKPSPRQRSLPAAQSPITEDVKM